MKKKSSLENNKGSIDQRMDKLRSYIRSHGRSYLDDPNISSIGIGHKVKDGKHTKELCIQFTVKKKAEGDQLEELGTTPIPKSLKIEDIEVPTDVIEREYHASYKVVQPGNKSIRKQRLNTLVPGISISHPKGTAGTLGAITYDGKSGQPCLLSNWHVLHTPEGKIGDPVVQPGPFDDNRISENYAGILIRSHLGLAGDCAIARIEKRSSDPTILELNTKISRLARPELGDRVVKSGRTTGVTYGIVRRVDTIVKIDYGGDIGTEQIGGFEIGPTPNRPAENNEISMGGDSGAVWLIAKDDGTPTNIMVGLHFAGEGQNDPDDHAMACYAHSVFEKLEISIEPTTAPGAIEEIYQPKGYDTEFLGHSLPVPKMQGAAVRDVVKMSGSGLIQYTHFSVCLSKERRMAHFVAWNIDGGSLKSLSRSGLKFTYDKRLDARYQVGNEVYADNKLDRGHIARRADLCWGNDAVQANKDSFFYTNITPQHQAFNQSEKHGLWGLLENAIFEDVDVEGLRISVMAGPIFRDRDFEYRGIKIPSDFWKVIVYVDSQDLKLKTKAYILTQKNLLNDIEALELDPFRLWQVSIKELESRNTVRFGELRKFDTFVPAELPEEIKRAVPKNEVREIFSREDLIR